MKQNKLLILSLLASFLLLISASYATAQNTVTFGTVDDCPKPAGEKVYVPVLVDNGVDLAALDIVGQIVTVSGVDLVVTGVAFDNRMDLTEILDQRFPIGDLGSGAFRLGAIKLDYLDLAAGSGQIATLELEYVSDCLLGTATLDAGSVDCGGDTKSTVFADAETNLITPTVVGGAVNVVNAAPTITFCPDDYIIYWGDNVTVTVEADDPDLACGCDDLTFTLLEGPGSINAATGLYQFVATPAEIGCNYIQIKVADNYGGEAFCEFNIDVLNHPPEITCPGEVINILWGQTVNAPVTGVDPDGGPSAMTFTLMNPGSYPGSPTVDPGTGDFTWVTEEDNAFLGLWEFEVVVTDGANLDECNTENADTCNFFVHIDPKFRVTIEKIHDQLQGHYTEVGVNLDGSYTSMNMGGYDFLIAYDAPGLTFVEAMPGDLLTNCGWEYFTYRYGATGNCGNACPSGMLRIVAIAETNNGPNHPTGYNNTECNSTELAVLKFFVSNDRTFECMYLPIRFFWTDCNDNTISSQFGDTLFLVDRVYDFEGTDITNYTEFPNYTGAPDDPCMLGDKEFPLRAIDFKNGGVDVVCADSIDARGDINANGLPNEIADAVMLTNYFINGLSAFGDHVEASIAASDVNADGITLSVADLVYLVRVIQGDALPYPKYEPGASSIELRTQVIGQQMTVGYLAEENVGAVLLRFEFTGEVGTPILGSGAEGMELKYSVNGNEMNVLVYNIGQNSIKAGDNVLMTIPVTGDINLTEVDAADFYGNVLSHTAHILPSKFDLAQNYPNPFNPTTTINLALPVAADYSVAIYNIAGQLIRTYDGNASAGVVSIVWDGMDASGNQVASGIYFYKAQAGKFSATKKMLLMK
jgi:hypothetical protein